MIRPGATGPMERAALLCVAAALLLLTARPLHGFDTWWHLAAGREMARTGQLLRAESFSYTAEGTPWINHEWLWQIGAWSLYRAAAGDDDDRAVLEAPAGSPARQEALGRRARSEAGGASLLTLVNGVLLAAALLLGLGALRRAGAGLAGSAAAVLFCALGASGRFLVRPEAATLLLAPLVLSLLDRARLPAGGGGGGAGGFLRTPAGLCLAVPLLVALGANLHPGALAIPFLVALFVAGDRLARRAAPDGAVAAGGRLPLRAGPAVLLVGLAFAATCANPSGWSLWRVPLALARIVRSEHYYNPEWLPPGLSDAPLFFAALALAVAVVLLSRRRGGFDAATFLPMAAVAMLAAGSIRHVGLFFVILPFALARPLAALLRPARSPALTIALAGAVAVWAFATGTVGLGVDRTTTPVDACDFIALHEPEGRLYNDVRFGGYLAWRFDPGRKVFIDGRNELYVPVLSRLEGIYSGSSPYTDWLDLVGGYGIEAALVRYSPERKGVIFPAEGDEPARRARIPYSVYLFPAGHWSLAYWDDAAMLFLRRSGPNVALIERFGYTAVNPEDPEFVLERAAREPGYAAEVLGDLQRRLGEPPPSSRARDLLDDLTGLRHR